MGAPRHDRGQDAERAVASWLESHGWQVLAMRHRTRQGEIDLVTLDPGRCLVAVEVRYRASARAGAAVASVQPRHLRRVRGALASYAHDARVRHNGLRVDLVAVSPGPDPRTWRLTRVPGIDGW